MPERVNNWDVLICLLRSMERQLEILNASANGKVGRIAEYVHLPFRGVEIYLFHKAFIDSGGAPNENYKTLLEKTVQNISNKTQKGFSADSLSKYSDKVDPESRETVKRFLQKMIRNIDNYE